MPATRQEIYKWLIGAKESGATHLIIVCDTYDWTDFPVMHFIGPVQDTIDSHNDHQKMMKVMEVYDMSLDLDMQLNEPRAYHIGRS